MVAVCCGGQSGCGGGGDGSKVWYFVVLIGGVRHSKWLAISSYLERETHNERNHETVGL